MNILVKNAKVREWSLSTNCFWFLNTSVESRSNGSVTNRNKIIPSKPVPTVAEILAWTQIFGHERLTVPALNGNKLWLRKHGNSGLAMIFIDSVLLAECKKSMHFYCINLWQKAIINLWAIATQKLMAKNGSFFLYSIKS